jgi:hypothetical protein
LLAYQKMQAYIAASLETSIVGAMTRSRSTNPSPNKTIANPAAPNPPLVSPSDYPPHGIPHGVQLTPNDAAFRKDPYAVYRLLRERDPVHRGGYSLSENSWAVTEHEAVRDILQMEKISANPRALGMEPDPRPGSPKTQHKLTMLQLDNPDHKRLRSLVQQAFTPKAIEAFRPRIEAIVDEVLDDLKEQASFDIVADFADPIPTIAIAELLGVNRKDHEDFKRWSASLAKANYPEPTPEQWREMIQADGDLRTNLKMVVAERRAEPRDDLVSALIKARDQDDRLSEGEMISMCWLLIQAGNITTSDLIGNGVLAFLQHPEQCAKLRSAPHLIGNAVEEILRFDTPVLYTNRFATTDFNLGDKNIRRGDTLSVILAAANHDPKKSDDPEAFDIGRDDVQHLAFGRGIHHCIGAPLARLEAQIAVTKLLETFPVLEIDEEEVVHRKMGSFRGCKRLRVRAVSAAE